MSYTHCPPLILNSPSRKLHCWPRNMGKGSCWKKKIKIKTFSIHYKFVWIDSCWFYAAALPLLLWGGSDLKAIMNRGETGFFHVDHRRDSVIIALLLTWLFSRCSTFSSWSWRIPPHLLLLQERELNSQAYTKVLHALNLLMGETHHAMTMPGL